MANNLKIKKYRSGGNLRLYGNAYRPIQLTYKILYAIYDRTIFKEIVQTFVANIVPPFYTLAIEDVEGNRMPELEKECKNISRLVDRSFMAEIQKWFFVFGTALVYDGNRDLNNNIEELFLLHPADVIPVWYELGDPKYGEIKHWLYTYGGKTYEIPPDDIKVYANDPYIGDLFGNSLLNHMQDTLAQFLNNRVDLAEILNRYAIPIVQWAVDVTDVNEQNQDNFINQVKRSIQQQFGAGDDLITDARVEARTLSFANDVSHLITILDSSRKDLGMLGVPEALMGGQISNLSGGKTQASVFMTKVEKYRAILNDYLAKKYYIPDLERKGKIFGEHFHNIYIQFPLATTELPADKVIWLKTSVEMGWITNNEARMQLGFRGAAPGVTPELEEIFKVRSIQYSNDDGNQTDPTSQKTKVDEPKDRSGRDPEGSDSKKKSDAGETK